MSNDSKKRDVALVVDDSPDALRLLTDALDNAGMTVMVALDGTSAMRIVEQITPDIILLDAVMPGIDGFETCRRLKRASGLDHVPVIFMTGLAETEHIIRGLEAGGVDYVTKPIVIAEMLARIKVHLANARLTQSARAALDVSGRSLFAVNRTGEIMWSTPQALKLLAQDQSADSSGDTFTLPRPWREWLEQIAGGQTKTKPPETLASAESQQLRLQYMGRLGTNEFLLRLRARYQLGIARRVQSGTGTDKPRGRSAVVAQQGKTNRDIAQILGLSPRTVDKHLEQIYAKLGVENRTAAAAVANANQKRSG